MVRSTAVFYLWAIVAPVAFAITTNYRDSYISAYMDFQTSTEPHVGVVYPEPPRIYGPPQPKPPPHYGPPGYPPAPPPPPEIPMSEHPLINLVYHLPEKLEFLPKLITGFLGITKVLLKVVLLKIILKLVVMFCLFFFLPKLEMLDMVTDMEPTTKPSVTASASANATAAMASTAAAPLMDVMDDEEERRFNRMAEFVLESIETKPFLKKYCDEEKHKVKCKLVTLLSKLEKYTMEPIRNYWLRDSIKNDDNFHAISSRSEST